MEIVFGILIPFVGTTLGSFMVFFMKNSINNNITKLLIGFSAGVMVAASIWSLLLPAIEQSESLAKLSWLPATIGLILGFAFLIVIDIIVNKMTKKNNLEGFPQKSKKTKMLIFAITIHNIPEGMAVGVALASAYFGNIAMTMASALMLAIGIAIQNFPEGAIVSMPLKCEGTGKFKAFVYGTLSGIVEPIFATITFFITGFIVPILPYVLSFAAGTMLYVVIKELIPEAQADEKFYLSTIGFALGFIVMMMLDVMLG